MQDPGKPENGLGELLGRIEELYSPPPIVAHFNRVLADPDATAQDVADAISTDVGMAAKVMRLVNSSYFGFARRVGNLKTAIVVLGFKEIRKLVLTLGTIRALTRRASAFPFMAFWRHSVAVGFFGEALLERRAPKLKDDAFVAGLLHDVGKLVLAQDLPEPCERVRERVARGAAWALAEREILGFDHAELGGELGALWQFPEMLVAAIRQHHAVAGAGDRSAITAAIQLGDLCTRACSIDIPDSGPLPAVDARVWDVLGVRPTELDQFFARLPAAFGFIEEIVNAAELPGGPIGRRPNFPAANASFTP